MIRWRQRLALGAYSALLFVLQPAYLGRLWWRGRAEPLYRHAVRERFGRYADVPSAGWVWVHAVSLGETRAAAALVEALRVIRPGMRLLLTHSTATGRDAGKSLLRDGDVQAWLPYDTPAAARRFFAQFRPVVGVLMETEVWPNLVLAAEEVGVPMVLANARLSEKSFRMGQRIDLVLRPAAESLALALAQTEDDAVRLRSAGVRQVFVSGNLKFDMTPDAAQLAMGRAWRHVVRRDVVLAAITREGEEAALLAVWKGIALPRPLLLIVPRHPQRFEEVAQLILAEGFTLARRSSWSSTLPEPAAKVDVWLGDSMQEMAAYYSIAQVALLGGSFAPLGGQNLIEAASCGCPVVMGEHTFNFAEAAELAIRAGAACRVADLVAGVRQALAWLDPGALQHHRRKALDFAGQYRGASLRMAERIGAALSKV